MTDYNESMRQGSGLQRLRDIDDLQVADGYPDIRGWDVQTRDGQKLGKVDDLVVSASEMRARYLDVDVKDQGHALVPIGSAQLDDEHDVVIVSGINATDFDAYPRYMSGNASGTSTNMQGADYDDDRFDDQRLFARRRGNSGRMSGEGEVAERLTVSEEQLAVGKRQVQAGEVELRKTVETEHVREQVPLMHEEVTVERRPVSGDSMGAATIGSDQEIRVPLMREEAIVEKRPVVREEIIVRKRMVTENQTVEADLRRERLDESGLEASQRNMQSRGTMDTQRTIETGRELRGGDQGLADRAADTVDDIHDRMDGNPASRPGRDSTDRLSR